MSQFIYIIGLFLSFFLGLLILSKKRKYEYDFILSLWLFLTGLHILIFYLHTIDYPISYELELLNASFPLLQWPFLFIYSMLILKVTRLKPLLLLHLLPFLFVVILLNLWHDAVFRTLIFTIIISGIGYLISTLKLLNQYHQPMVRSSYSWLKLLTIGLGIIWMIFSFIVLSNLILNIIIVNHSYIFLSINMFVFIIGYLGLKNGYLLQEPHLKRSYATSSLEKDDLTIIYDKIKFLLIEKKVFLQAELNLKTISDELKIPAHHLSQVFSLLLNTNYYDYINKLRIEEFKKLASDEELEKKSMLGIALDCGFNSKSTFNRAFKKHCGITPTQYIKSKEIGANQLNGSQDK